MSLLSVPGWCTKCCPSSACSVFLHTYRRATDAPHRKGARIGGDADTTANQTQELLAKVAAQLEAQAAATERTEAANAATLRKMEQIQADLAAKEAPRRWEKLKSPGLQKHVQPLEQAHGAMTKAAEALAGHASGEEPMTPEQAERLKAKLDEGMFVVDQRITFHEDCERLGFDVAKELDLLKEQKEMDPVELALKKKAQKHVEKRKAEKTATKAAKQQKGGQPKFQRSPFFGGGMQFGRGSFEPGYGQYGMGYSAPVPVQQYYAGNGRGGGRGRGFGGGPGSFSGGRGGGFTGMCWKCQQPGHKADMCSNAGGVAANAGRQIY